MSWHLSQCRSRTAGFHETLQDYALYCYSKNQLDLGVDPSQNGGMAAILHFCYNVLNRYHLNNTVRARAAYSRLAPSGKHMEIYSFYTETRHSGTSAVGAGSYALYSAGLIYSECTGFRSAFLNSDGSAYHTISCQKLSVCLSAMHVCLDVN